MDAQRFVFKLYTEQQNPVHSHSFVEVFHDWIQNRRLADEVMIDVADYNHVEDGPGVVLVCHAANYSVDRLDGRLGLTFNRKREAPGALSDRLASALRSTVRACQLLEEHPKLIDKVRFSPKEILFRVNDRLLGPNDADTHSALEPELRALGEKLYAEAPVEIARLSEDTRELYSLRITAASGPPTVAGLLERL